MPRKYSRSSKSSRSRRSRRIRRQRGGGVFEFIVAYSGSASAGAAKLNALKTKFSPVATNIVESPLPAGKEKPPPNMVAFKWSITTSANSLSKEDLISAVNKLTGADAISSFIVPEVLPPVTTNPAPTTTTTTNPAPTARQVETPSNDPNVAEIYLFVDPANAPPVIQKGGSNPFSTKTNLTGTATYVENTGISLAHNPSKKISKVEFSPILVAANTTTPQKFSVESSATLRDNSLLNVYTPPTINPLSKVSSSGILVLPKLTDPTMYISGTTKNWAKPTSQETQNLLPTTVQGYNNPTPPNLKITLTFVNP